MSELAPLPIDEILTACRNGLEQTGAALGRTFDVQLTAELGEPLPYAAADTAFTGGGVVFLYGLGERSILVTVPVAGGVLPAWVAEVNATNTGKLAALTETLAPLLLPESAPIEDLRAAYVANLSAALASAEPASDAVVVPLTLQAGEERRARLSLITSFGRGPNALVAQTVEAAPSAAKPIVEPAATSEVEDEPVESNPGFERLPPYSRSLLRIKVPVNVTLAHKKQSLRSIVEIAPGTILQFRKACDQPLELEVNGHTIGEGEAVKVGDKFGLRITSMKLPGEAFHPVHPPLRKTG